MSVQAILHCINIFIYFSIKLKSFGSRGPRIIDTSAVQHLLLGTVNSALLFVTITVSLPQSAVPTAYSSRVPFLAF